MRAIVLIGLMAFSLLSCTKSSIATPSPPPSVTASHNTFLDSFYYEKDYFSFKAGVDSFYFAGAGLMDNSLRGYYAVNTGTIFRRKN